MAASVTITTLEQPWRQQIASQTRLLAIACRRAFDRHHRASI